jgi:YVTN family beta-propeller protein
VVTVSPRADTTDIRIDTSILVNFSERIESSTLNAAFKLRVLGQSPSLGGGGVLVNGGRSLVFTPTNPLAFQTTYELTIGTELTDREGVHLANPYVTRFTTQDAPPVAITDIQPRSAAKGSFITILGTGFDPAGNDSVEFAVGFAPGYVRGPAASVTPISMLVRVPFFATSGAVRVRVNDLFSNPFNITVLPQLPQTAPSRLTDVALSFSPTDVVVAPAGDTAFAVGQGGLATLDLSTYQVLVSDIGAAQSLALTPDGRRAVVTRPASGDVVTVDVHHGSGTFGQVIGRTPLPPGANPRGVAIAPTGRMAFVADPGARLIYKIDLDPTSATLDSVVDEISDSIAILNGSLAVSPVGDALFYGAHNLGARLVRIPGHTPEAVGPSPATVQGGVAVDPAAMQVLYAGVGSLGAELLSSLYPLDPLSGETKVVLGGTVPDVAFGADGRSAYAVNSMFDQVQMVDTDTSHTTYLGKIAEVGTGSLPVAIGLGGSGDVIAVANYGSRSISVYVTGGTAALVRAVPAVARPGDVVALQGTGAPFGAGSKVDVGAGTFDPSRRAPGSNAAAFVVPAGSQRDGSIAVVDSLGMRTLGLPFRIVDPISPIVPRETGFAKMLDSVLVGPDYHPTNFTTMTVSPDGQMLAITRERNGFGEQLDLVLVGEDGINRMGAILASFEIVPPGYYALGAGFTPDGKQLWVTGNDMVTRIADTDRGSPSFGSQLPPLPSIPGARVGPIGVDPLGRYMIEGDYISADSLHLYRPDGEPLGAIAVGGWIASIAVSPEGRTVVAAGTGRVNFGDLDGMTALPATAVHGGTASRDWSIAIPLNGKRAVVRYPDASFGIYNLDPAAGAVGTELYFGNALPVGVPVGQLAPAPDGKSVLIARPGQAVLSVLDPSALPPTVTTVATTRPIGPMALSADGRRLWTEGGAGTTQDSLRLVTLSRAASLALVSGGAQSALPSQFLPQPLRFRATDGNGSPQVGAMLRFDGVSGLLPILDNWDTPLWHLTDANGEVSVRWMVSSVPGTDSLVVSLLGASGVSTLATAQVVVAENLLPPAVLSLGPADGATNLNAGTGVSATFNKVMDSTSVAAKMRLYAGPNLVGGAFKPSVGGKTFIFQPSQPPAFSARCSLVVESGVVDTYGLTTASGATSVFTIQGPPALQIASLSPPAGKVGIPVVIAGQGFSAVATQNTVLFNGVLATVTSASATSVVATVPLAATSGPVTVQVGGSSSNTLNFVVLETNPGPGGVVNNLSASQGVRDVAITSDGTRAYVTNPVSNSVTALDIPGAQTITNITVGLNPQGVALLPDDSRAYVANTGSNDVSVIDIRPASPDYHHEVAKIPVGAAPIDIAVSAVGPRVIVVGSGSSVASIIDANPGNGTYDQVIATSNLGSGGQSVTISPDGARAFVATSGGTVEVIDILTGAVIATSNLGSGGQSVTISPDGTILIVLCQDGSLQIIDVAAGSPSQYQVIATSNLGSGGQSVTISPDGALVYVTNADGSVLVFSVTPSNVPGAVVISPGASVVLALVATIPVGQNPAGIAIDPSRGAFALVCNSGSGTVSVIGFPTSLPPVVLEFDFNPNTFNLKSMGKWVTGYLEPRPPRVASEIVVPSIRLNGVVPVDLTAPHSVGDHDHDGLSDLMVKFSRSAVSLALGEGDHVPVTVTGTVGPRLFTGTDTIKVKRAKVTAPVAHEIVHPNHRYTVRWEVPKGFDGAWVAVLHTFDDGENWVLDASRLANTGAYEWEVPSVAADSARIGIVLVDSEGETGDEVIGVLSVSEVFQVFGPTEVESAPAVLTFAPIQPNPARGQAMMRFGLPRAAEIRLEVFDLQGRRVRALAMGPHAAGWHEVGWNGRTDSGGRLGAGLYFVRFRAGDREFRQRLVWLK